MRNHVWLLALVMVGCSGAAETTGTAEGEPEGALEPQARAVAILDREVEDAWRWSMGAGGKAVSHVEGQSAVVLGKGVTARHATVAFVGKFRDLYRVADPASAFAVEREEHDRLGMTHLRMRQVVRGVTVADRELMAHFDARGVLRSIDSTHAPDLGAVDVAPSLSSEEAVAAAIADLASRYADVRDAEVDTQPELQVYAPDEGAPRLSYHLDVRLDVENVWLDYLIDARSGGVLRSYDKVQTIRGSGRGAAGDTKVLEVEADGGEFVMADLSRTPNGIRTYTLNNAASGNANILVSNNVNVWDMVEVGPGAAVDAHHYAGVTYDYFFKKHNRRGFDGQDATIISVAHVSRNLNNASWNGRNMAYGDGDGVNFRPLSAALDVVAHELTHAVITSTSNLRYQNQSGALNESVADIFGSIVEHEAQPDEKKNWLCGEDASLRGTAFRDLAHPAPRQPDHMSKYVNTTQDNGGVHINSGIPNNAFYLMTMGGANDTSKIEVARGLGWDKAAQVWYRAQVNYFMQNTNLVQGAQGTLSAAKDLNFTEDEQNIVECAWISVGVLPGQCKPIAPAPAGEGAKDAGAGEEPGATPTPGTDDGNGAVNGLDEGDDAEFEAPLLRRRKSGSFCNTVGGAGLPGGQGVGLAIATALGLALARRRRAR